MAARTRRGGLPVGDARAEAPPDAGRIGVVRPPDPAGLPSVEMACHVPCSSAVPRARRSSTYFARSSARTRTIRSPTISAGRSCLRIRLAADIEQPSASATARASSRRGICTASSVGGRIRLPTPTLALLVVQRGMAPPCPGRDAPALRGLRHEVAAFPPPPRPVRSALVRAGGSAPRRDPCPTSRTRVLDVRCPTYGEFDLAGPMVGVRGVGRPRSRSAARRATGRVRRRGHRAAGRATCSPARQGFGVRTLWCLRQFYQLYPSGSLLGSPVNAARILTAPRTKSGSRKILTAPQTESASVPSAAFPPNLGWAHCRVLLNVANDDARAFYEIEAAREGLKLVPAAWPRAGEGAAG